MIQTILWYKLYYDANYTILYTIITYRSRTLFICILSNQFFILKSKYDISHVFSIHEKTPIKWNNLSSLFSLFPDFLWSCSFLLITSCHIITDDVIVCVSHGTIRRLYLSRWILFAKTYIQSIVHGPLNLTNNKETFLHDVLVILKRSFQNY